MTHRVIVTGEDGSREFFVPDDAVIEQIAALASAADAVARGSIPGEDGFYLALMQAGSVMVRIVSGTACFIIVGDPVSEADLLEMTGWMRIN